MRIVRQPENQTPAIEGGEPLFPSGLPLARPTVSEPDRVGREVVEILQSGTLTNGPRVARLEEMAARYLGVRHCVAVASCTAGLMLVLRAKNLSGDVVVPSFTFSATAHAVAWNNLRPVFADIDPNHLTLSPGSVRDAMGIRVSAILATHTFGTPCDVRGLVDVAVQYGIPLFFDAAHAFGSRYSGHQIGRFGEAEVFSLSPTKLLIGGEGGLIATNNDLLAERCRIGRDYGNPGDYDCRFVGLNARMSEIHAAVAIASFADLEERIEKRNELAGVYRQVAQEIPGVQLPLVRDDDRSTYKDLTILIDEPTFGMNAEEVSLGLVAEGIETRRYYSPPVHLQMAYRWMRGSTASLAETERVASSVVTLPLWPGMSHADVCRVGTALQRLRSLSARRRQKFAAEKIRQLPKAADSTVS